MVEPIDIRTGKPFQSRRCHEHHPPSDGASLGGIGMAPSARARGLMGGAFMGCMMAAQGREPSIWRYDGKMHFWYSLNEENFNDGVVSFKFFRVIGTATVSWGDGSTSTMSGTDISHTYAAIGDYEVVVDGFATVTLTADGFIRYSSQLVRVELGSPFSLQFGSVYCFRNLPSLTRINMNGYNLQCGGNFLSECVSAVEIVDASFSSLFSQSFYGNTSLTSVGDLTSCTSIGDNAFHNCTSLTKIADLAICTSIGNFSFNQCSSLAEVGDLSSVTSVGSYAFRSCSSLTSLTFSSRTHTEVQGITGFANFPQRRTCVFHCADGDYYSNGTSLLPVS